MPNEIIVEISQPQIVVEIQKNDIIIEMPGTQGVQGTSGEESLANWTQDLLAIYQISSN